MIIINQVYGQLCNQLFLFAHILAYCLEHGNRVWFPGFYVHEEHFPYFLKKGADYSDALFTNSKIHPHEERVYKFLRRFFHSDSKLLRGLSALLHQRFSLRLEPLQDTCFPESGNVQIPLPICFFEGWMFRVPTAFRNHQETIRSVFNFEPTVRQKVQNWLDQLTGGVIIGVHIRLGDYETLAPQWAYSLDQYRMWMDGLREQSQGRCVFVVVSDAVIPDFSDPDVFHHRGSAFEDLCLLSLCDFVMGPPSTFNRWAAFMGAKPHFCVWDAARQPNLDDFREFRMISGVETLGQGEIEAIKWFGIA